MNAIEHINVCSSLKYNKETNKRKSLPTPNKDNSGWTMINMYKSKENKQNKHQCPIVLEANKLITTAMYGLHWKCYAITELIYVRVVQKNQIDPWCSKIRAFSHPRMAVWYDTFRIRVLRTSHLQPYRTSVPYFSSIFEAYRTNVPYPYHYKKGVPYQRTVLLSKNWGVLYRAYVQYHTVLPSLFPPTA